MAPFLNSTTVGFMVSLSLHFRSRVRHMPPVAREIFAYLCGLFFTISFCLGITALTTILLIPCHLKSPLPIVQLHSVTVTVTSLTTTAVNLTATFLFKNHNRKLIVSYANLEAKLWFGNDNLTLAVTNLTTFSQGTESVTRVEAKLTVVDGFGNNSSVVKRIEEDRVRGEVKFGVSLLGLVWFRNGNGNGVMKTRSVRLRVVCDRVVVVFPPGNKNGIGSLVSPLVCDYE